VEFTDNASSTNKDHYKEMLFSSGSYPTGSMRGFSRKLQILILISQVIFLAGIRYRRHTNTILITSMVKVIILVVAKRLVEDAVNAARSDVNFADYDSDGDGQVDAI